MAIIIKPSWVGLVLTALITILSAVILVEAILFRFHYNIHKLLIETKGRAPRTKGISGNIDLDSSFKVLSIQFISVDNLK